jgi:hypothetical protein
MGFLDKAKDARSKAETFAGEHSSQLKGALDKVEDAANKATKGKYKDKISSATDKADGYVDGLKSKDTQAPTEETPPPAQ